MNNKLFAEQLESVNEYRRNEIILLNQKLVCRLKDIITEYIETNYPDIHGVIYIKYVSELSVILDPKFFPELMEELTEELKHLDEEVLKALHGTRFRV